MTQICTDPTSPMGQDPKAKASALGGRFPLNIRSPAFDNRASFGYAVCVGRDDRRGIGVP